MHTTYTPPRRTGFARLAKFAAIPFLAASLAGGAAHAAGYPDKTVKFVVNFPPGGPIDVIARLAASKIEKDFKQAVIVENTTGASGNIGAGAVARAEPDGYTVLFTIDTPLTVSPYVYRSMPFKQDALKPVIMMGSAGSVLAVHPSTGINSLKELVARAQDRNLTFSSAGTASPGHIGVALLSEATGIKATHVPYRGNAPAVLSLVSGEVDAGILATPGLLPPYKAGKGKPIAITGPDRSALLPDVPTTAELGIPDVRVDFMFLALVPSKTPDNVVETLRDAIAKAIRQPDVEERLRALDIRPATIPGSEVADRIAKAQERYRKVIQETGMKAD